MKVKKYLKFCEGCLKYFRAGSNGNCPYCGYEQWLYVKKGLEGPPVLVDSIVSRQIDYIPQGEPKTINVSFPVHAAEQAPIHKPVG